MELPTYMLADGARLGQDGKLYIFGGQWDRIFTPQVPFNQPTLAIALVIEIDYAEATERHRVEVTLRTSDGAEAGRKAIAQLQTGHPPMLELGSPFRVAMAIEQQNVTFQAYGRYEWLIELDGEIKGRLPISVMPLPIPQLPFGAPPTTPRSESQEK